MSQKNLSLCFALPYKVGIFFWTLCTYDKVESHKKFSVYVYNSWSVSILIVLEQGEDDIFKESQKVRAPNNFAPQTQKPNGLVRKQLHVKFLPCGTLFQNVYLQKFVLNKWRVKLQMIQIIWINISRKVKVINLFLLIKWYSFIYFILIRCCSCFQSRQELKKC